MIKKEERVRLVRRFYSSWVFLLFIFDLWECSVDHVVEMSARAQVRTAHSRARHSIPFHLWGCYRLRRQLSIVAKAPELTRYLGSNRSGRPNLGGGSRFKKKKSTNFLVGERSVQVCQKWFKKGRKIKAKGLKNRQIRQSSWSSALTKCSSSCHVQIFVNFLLKLFICVWIFKCEHRERGEKNLNSSLKHSQKFQKKVLLNSLLKILSEKTLSLSLQPIFQIFHRLSVPGGRPLPNF